MTQDASAFVAEYVAAHQAHDVERLASFYFLPTVFLLKKDVVAILDGDDLTQFLERAFRAFRSNDEGTKFAASLLAQRMMGAKVTSIDVDWKITDDQGGTVQEFRVTYDLIDIDGRWKIVLIARHE
jgi:ketosteroid isomerase-like protein